MRRHRQRFNSPASMRDEADRGDRGDRPCDVCVIGAGIAGLSVAYHLCRAAKKVIVVDDSQVGDGQTGRTSAHLSSEWDDRYLEAERALGAQASAQIYDSHSKAIDTI